MKQWLQKQEGRLLPKSVLGQAVSYTSNDWKALVHYQEPGYVAIGNDLSEQTLRVIALGCNNWIVLNSVVGTCKHLGMNPFAYLREALPRLCAETSRQVNDCKSGCRIDGCCSVAGHLRTGRH